MKLKIRKTGKHRCKTCGIKLNGVAHSVNNKLSLSHKKPERMHGGSLCTQCIRAVIVNMAEAMV